MSSFIRGSFVTVKAGWGLITLRLQGLDTSWFATACVRVGVHGYETTDSLMRPQSTVSALGGIKSRAWFARSAVSRLELVVCCCDSVFPEGWTSKSITAITLDVPRSALSPQIWRRVAKWLTVTWIVEKNRRTRIIQVKSE